LKVLTIMQFHSDGNLIRDSVLEGSPAGRCPPKQHGTVDTGGRLGPEDPHSVMILPQVHLRNGFWSSVLAPPVSRGARLYLKQDLVDPTHFHLVCEHSPYPPGPGDLGALLRIAHGLCGCRSIQVVCYHPPCD
jgi:hypothetical protein